MVALLPETHQLPSKLAELTITLIHKYFPLYLKPKFTNIEKKKKNPANHKGYGKTISTVYSNIFNIM